MKFDQMQAFHKMTNVFRRNVFSEKIANCRFSNRRRLKCVLLCGIGKNTEIFIQNVIYSYPAHFPVEQHKQESIL
jgi:hypothetical protein